MYRIEKSYVETLDARKPVDINSLRRLSIDHEIDSPFFSYFFHNIYNV